MTYKTLRGYDLVILNNILKCEKDGLEKNKKEGLWWRVESSNKAIAKIEKVIKEKLERRDYL